MAVTVWLEHVEAYADTGKVVFTVSPFVGLLTVTPANAVLAKRRSKNREQ